ncbi:MAG TPA: class E sortase [Actinomycetes bacterium]|nr:class E sortase [Actinomycetes bacterium]
MRRFLRSLGWTMISLGAFTLYFLVYQLIGTNAVTDKAQTNLRNELTSQWSAAGRGQAGQRAARGPLRLVDGKAFAIIQIRKIKLDKAVVQGSGRNDLRKGPGHIVTTKLPGQPGTFAIACHRTTYGAPCYNLDRLERGDQILITTRDATYEYRVTRTRIVVPTDVTVLKDVRGPDGQLKATIVMSTCHPRFSARQRLIVFGDLVATRPAPGAVSA